MKKQLLFEVPEMNYSIFCLYDARYMPFVAAYGYHEKEDYWAQGHYFETLGECLEYMTDLAKEQGKTTQLYKALLQAKQDCDIIIGHLEGLIKKEAK